MKNIYILKTDKPSRLLKDLVDGTYQLKKEVLYGNRFELPLNIYIISDEEIKEGDWWINLDDSNIYHTIFWQLANNAPSCKKIVLTTDPDLIKDGVQPIDDEFLEWFVNNPNCEKVVVHSELNMNGANGLDRARFIYKIIIPFEQFKNK